MKLAGRQQVEIARHFKVSEAAVSRWFNKPHVINFLTRTQEQAGADAVAEIQIGAVKAARYLVAAVNPDNKFEYKRINGNGIKAAMAILDRVGLSAYVQRQHDGEAPDMSEVLNEEEVKALVSRIPQGAINRLREVG